MTPLLGSEDLGHGIRQLTISNPARKNALGPEFFDALEAALSNSEGVRVWLLRGSAQIFSAGFDLQALAGWKPGTLLPDERLGDVLDQLSAHRAPSVALVNGPAFGAGCELAMACDFRVADATAKFCLPPVKIGVVYSQRGLARVANRIGLQRARYLFLTGEVVDGAHSFERGLVDVPVSDDAEGAALALCRTLSAGAPLAMEGMKVGLDLLAVPGPWNERFEKLRRDSFASDDAREGRRAVLEKRTPVFSGK